MSADSQLSVVSMLPSVTLSAALSDAEQQTVNTLLALLGADNSDSILDADTDRPTVTIKRFVDGRGLACPMPLLKAKVALRDVANGESLYVVATDVNSRADITAFCRQSQQTSAVNQLSLTVNKGTAPPQSDALSSKRFDTIYHFIITKTDSN
ncbi:sulfurtransferase TusA family protein [Psychrobacter sp. AOP22-C1-C5]|uniref:sulfurtransferase TusA family protein n=1 Tax=Psychrobacter sp. AOP22-C1-C5 TaxID=3457716 RepID=UPI0040360BBA